MIYINVHFSIIYQKIRNFTTLKRLSAEIERGIDTIPQHGGGGKYNFHRKFISKKILILAKILINLVKF